MRSTERSSHRVMQKNSRSMNLSGDTNLAPQKDSSGANDVMSMFVHVLSFECGGSTVLWTVADTEVVYLKFEVNVNGI